MPNSKGHRKASSTDANENVNIGGKNSNKKKDNTNSEDYHFSEKNCTELVQKLLQRSFLPGLVPTVDGKAYITTQQLDKEIFQELDAFNGRASLLDLQSSINVEKQSIERRTLALVKQNDELFFCNQELIGKPFIEALVEEINDKLAQVGKVCIMDICKTHSLTFEFISSIIEKYWDFFPGIKVDPLDKGALYTNRYVKRQKRLVRGLLCAVTRPTPLSSLSSHPKIHQHLFLFILENLISQGQVNGFLKCKKSKNEQNIEAYQNQEGIYVPNIYIRAQENWIRIFYEKKKYIQLESITKLEVEDPRKFIIKRFPDALPLHSCAVNSSFVDIVERIVKETVKENRFINILDILPNTFQITDSVALLQHIPYFKNRPPILIPPHRLFTNKEVCPIILSDVYITTTTYIYDIIDQLSEYIKLRASNYAKYYFFGNNSNKVDIYNNPSNISSVSIASSFSSSNKKPDNIDRETSFKIPNLENGDAYAMITLNELNNQVSKILKNKLNKQDLNDTSLCTSISSIIYRAISAKYRETLQGLKDEIKSENKYFQKIKTDLLKSWNEIANMINKKGYIFEDETRVIPDKAIAAKFSKFFHDLQVYIIIVYEPVSMKIEHDESKNIWKLKERFTGKYPSLYSDCISLYVSNVNPELSKTLDSLEGVLKSDRIDRFITLFQKFCDELFRLDFLKNRQKNRLPVLRRIFLI